MTDHLIRGCSIDGESGGLVIEYVTPSVDVRDNGLVINHALLIPPEDQFESVIEAVDLSLQRALKACLAVFEKADPLVLDESDDDAPSLYDNPEER